MKFTKKMEAMNEKTLEVALSVVLEELDSIEGIDEKIDKFNEVRSKIHEISPMKSHPTDYVKWVKSELVETQKINPNSVAPPEWEMLQHSILSSGYTMSTVGYVQEDGEIRIVDGFHRRKAERENKKISESTNGRIPITFVRKGREGEADRMSATILHNRARGSHSIDLMSTIVAELVEMGKGDRWICQHIGMSPDELLRLKQVTGVAALFNNKQFSDSWEPDKEFYED
jgi:hypothetical protein